VKYSSLSRTPTNGQEIRAAGRDGKALFSKSGEEEDCDYYG